MWQGIKWWYTEYKQFEENDLSAFQQENKKNYEKCIGSIFKQLLLFYYHLLTYCMHMFNKTFQ
jgi:hypothetical protein